MNFHSPKLKLLRLLALLLYALGLYGPSTTRGDFFFGPPVAAGIGDGNSSLPAPFFTPNSARFQQVYSASGFSDLNIYGGGYVRNVVFRVDPTLGSSFLTTIPSVQLNLSTTPRSSDDLSNTYADNVGSDNMSVLGPVSVVLDGVGGGGVSTFSIFFSFSDHPFFYNPANGNLLVDLQILTGAGGTPEFAPKLDAFSILGDEVSSVLAYGSTLPTTGTASTLGLATAFSIIPVPEPSSLALVAIAFGAMALSWKRVRKRD